MICSVCSQVAPLWACVDGFEYSDCASCGCIALNPSSMHSVDEGTFPRRYDPSYWASELAAARERSWGGSFARLAEALLYCRRPVEKFVDIGAGPGFLLDAVGTYLPMASHRFYGVESFPPSEHTSHPNYIVGDLADCGHMFDAGVCIEVVEHLSPAMLDNLAHALASRSNHGALYLINTSLADLVRAEDPGYIDPLNRGHIVAWSLPALAEAFGKHGFRTFQLKGRRWALCVEYLSDCDVLPGERIWSAPAENVAILHDIRMGSIPYILGIESARAYLTYA